MPRNPNASFATRLMTRPLYVAVAVLLATPVVLSETGKQVTGTTTRAADGVAAISPTGTRKCLVSGVEFTDGVYVDVQGARIRASSQECLDAMTWKRAFIKMYEAAQQVPERTPVHCSRERTRDEIVGGMAFIKGGEFERKGPYFERRKRSPEPKEHKPYRVRISPFYIDRFEVTNQQYLEFLNDGNPSYAKGAFKQDDDGRFVLTRPELARFPVCGVNHFQASGYAEWAGKRLPTEAEWELAAHGIERRKFPWGDEDPGKERANFGRMFGGQKPVGSFPKGQTPEGVHDLAGNIGEWCADFYDEASYAAHDGDSVVHDPKGPDNGFLRVYRLGCQCRTATEVDLRANLRCNASPFRAAGCVGFRCAYSQAESDSVRAEPADPQQQ